MTQGGWTHLVVAGVLTLIAMTLSAWEAALQTMSRSRAAEMVDEGLRNADKVARIAEDPAPFINTSTFLRQVAGITAIALVGNVVWTTIEDLWQQLLIVVGSMVLVSFIIWGVAPHTLGRQRANLVARQAAGPLMTLTALFGFIPRLLIAVGNAITPGRGYAAGPFSTEAELREMVDMAEARDLIAHDEREMIHSVFELGDTIVREVMVPRTDVVFIEADKTLRQALSLALRSGFSRIPVVGDDLDDVIGIAYLKDVMRRIYDHPEADKRESVRQVMRVAAFCPDSKAVDALLKEMQRTRNHLVIVIDEFGGTAGLATLEDIVEEIVGEITDEYDAEPQLAEPLAEGGFRISARMPLDDLGDLFDLDLSDEDVETAGGLLAKELNMVPIPGSSAEWQGLELTAEKSTRRRHQIDTMIVRLAHDGPAEQAEGGTEDD